MSPIPVSCCRRHDASLFNLHSTRAALCWLRGNWSSLLTGVPISCRKDDSEGRRRNPPLRLRNWYPSVRGFTAIRSSLLAKPADPTPGVLVITDGALLFQQWDEETKIFDVIKRLPYSELVAVSLDTYGLNRRIVLRKTDLSYDSFDFTQASGNFVDATKVEQAIEFLRGRIEP